MSEPVGYDVGDTVLITLDTTVEDTGGTPTHVDADTVTVTVKHADGTQSTANLSSGVEHTGLGAYAYRYNAPAVGVETWQWLANGTLETKPWAVSESDQIYVRANGQRIISLREAKNALRYGPNATRLDDDEIRDLIDSTTAEFERMCGPIIPRNATEWIYATPAYRDGVLRAWPVTALVSLNDDDDPDAAWRGGVYLVTDPESGECLGAYRSSVSGLLVYTIGWGVRPAFRQAARETVRHNWQGGRQRSAATVGTTFTPDDFDARAQLPGLPYGIPFAALNHLRPYLRPGQL